MSAPKTAAKKTILIAATVDDTQVPIKFTHTPPSRTPHPNILYRRIESLPCYYGELPDCDNPKLLLVDGSYLVALFALPITTPSSGSGTQTLLLLQEAWCPCMHAAMQRTIGAFIDWLREIFGFAQWNFGLFSMMADLFVMDDVIAAVDCVDSACKMASKEIALTPPTRQLTISQLLALAPPTIQVKPINPLLTLYLQQSIQQSPISATTTDATMHAKQECKLYVNNSLHEGLYLLLDPTKRMLHNHGFTFPPTDHNNSSSFTDALGGGTVCGDDGNIQKLPLGRYELCTASNILSSSQTETLKLPIVIRQETGGDNSLRLCARNTTKLSLKNIKITIKLTRSSMPSTAKAPSKIAIKRDPPNYLHTTKCSNVCSGAAAADEEGESLSIVWSITKLAPKQPPYTIEISEACSHSGKSAYEVDGMVLVECDHHHSTSSPPHTLIKQQEIFLHPKHPDKKIPLDVFVERFNFSYSLSLQ